MSIITTEDGSHTVFSDEFGVTYHSKHGAIQESMHVFINAGLLHFRDINPEEEISILEIGFGTGLNALLTLLTSLKMNNEVKYVALEKYPVEEEIYTELNYPAFLPHQNSQELFQQLHSCPWGKKAEFSDSFQLQKIQMDFHDIQFEDQFDVIYFDAFAPNAQPELWGTEIFEKIYKCMKKGGVMTTYCAKGQVKRNLKSLGFKLESLPGPPGKREMTRVTKV